MAAPVLKGIIISVTVIAALGIAILENPQVQVWLEEQRKKVNELLRSIGEDLDPESRRTAEAFAYEGRTPANDAGLMREVSGSTAAAALATGRALSGPSTIRRIPISGPADPDAAEERKRKGKEYLAQREKQMIELQMRRSMSKDKVSTPSSPTFDSYVDGEGKLKASVIDDKALPSPPAGKSLPKEIAEVERKLKQPMVEEPSSSSMSSFHLGSQMADPFSDEYALDRSMTPKPPLPPKVRFDITERETSEQIPGGFPSEPSFSSDRQQEEGHGNNDLSYEEQLAIALSLSESESAANAAKVRQNQTTDEADLMTAIAASLKDMDDRQAVHPKTDIDSNTPLPVFNDQLLVDITPSTTNEVSPKKQARSELEVLMGHHEIDGNHTLLEERGKKGLLMGRQEQEKMAQASYDTPPNPVPSVTSENTDELYTVTPQLTSDSLATLGRQQMATSTSSSGLPYDPVHEAAARQLQTPIQAMDLSFYSAPQSINSPLNHEAIEATNNDERLSFGFHTDSESGSQHHPRSVSAMSGAEMVELVEDSDLDVLSEDEDGIMTPDTWTEVGSNESETEGEHPHLEAH
ncbi:Hypothetical protein R9X50_00064500 [Acrodontium crateriforme]|uniref:Uncharacterized protein n=1 Tax=Acrodontium crateriforme TaxID=150365 RepID=A0AAQ3LXX4_9PEZI|nr:Hypothetical protein R9X50_00064500 [Acrodontium crateriforme]